MLLRVVLDVNVLVSGALGRPGPPARIVDEWYAGAFEVLVSPRLLEELRDVLARPKIEQDVSPQKRLAFLARLEDFGILVDDPALTERLVPSDPDDDYVVALARAGRAHVIVTGDAHLLEADLRPQAVPPREFLARIADIL